MPIESCDPDTYFVPGGFSKLNKVLTGYAFAHNGVALNGAGDPAVNELLPAVQRLR